MCDDANIVLNRKAGQFLFFFIFCYKQSYPQNVSSTFPVEPFFNNNDDVTNRKLYGVDIRFHDMRTRQKERGKLCWRLLNYLSYLMYMGRDGTLACL